MVLPSPPDAASDLAQDRRLAKRLGRTWPAFFERFGRLRPVQRATIPIILDGGDVVVSSPTASGKTEAACAPLVERFMEGGHNWTILYVSPTRALVNDLFTRLEGPIRRLGLRIARRTGDHRDPLSQRPHLILTTPESFDSLMCRGRLQPHGHSLESVSAVVLDEIHLLHGAPRGEQIRWLLERLRRLRREAKVRGWARDDGVQVVALSATIPDLEDVRAAYLRAPRDIPVLGGVRLIKIIDEPDAAMPTEEALPRLLANAAPVDRPRKVLVFANKRVRVDALASRLRSLLASSGYEVKAHHGSLAQPEREAAEAAGRAERALVLVATSTLEIGVDIGDIDLVVLDEPATSVPALLQRLGRGNRRGSDVTVLPCGEDPAQRLVHAAMLTSAKAGDLGPAEHGPQHSVARQQVASYIFQSPRRARSRSTLQGLLDACAAPVVAAGLLDHMVSTGELVEDEAGLRLGAEWLDRTGRGDIHSNIERSTGATVVDEATGRLIALDVREHTGPGIGVAGRPFEVRGRTDRVIEVRETTDAERSRGLWKYATSPWMKGAGQPQAVRRFLGLGPDEWPVEGTGPWHVFHFGGARRAAVLDLISRQTGHGRLTVNEWFLKVDRFEGHPPDWLLQIGPGALEVTIDSWLESLERRLGRPFANANLPRVVRVDEVRGWLGLDEEVAALRRAVWVAACDERVREGLRALVGERKRRYAGEPK